MRTTVAEFSKNVSGVTAIEYALIAGLASIGIVGAVTLIGSKLSSIFVAVGNGFH